MAEGFVEEEWVQGVTTRTRKGRTMRELDKELWNRFRQVIDGNYVLTDITATEDCRAYTMKGEDDQLWILPLRPKAAYILGLDVVGYSRRSIDGQLFLTSYLYAIVEQSVAHLRLRNWMPGTQPCVMIPTGDGAMLVFDDTIHLQFMSALLYHINMMIEDINRHYLHRGVAAGLDRDQDFPILPLHCRYAIAKGDVIHMEGLDGVNNAVGPGLVTCARILAASKGAHLLVQSDVMDDFDREGGIDGVARQGDPWNWEQSLHSALMPETKVKATTVRFYNVFGKYRPVHLMRAAGSTDDDVATYNIGSHDVSTIVL